MSTTVLQERRNPEHARATLCFLQQLNSHTLCMAPRAVPAPWALLREREKIAPPHARVVPRRRPPAARARRRRTMNMNEYRTARARSAESISAAGSKVCSLGILPG